MTISDVNNYIKKFKCLCFRYGKPMPASTFPSMYLRSYPSWAANIERVSEKLNNLSNDIVCEVLSHMCQYLEGPHVHYIAQTHFKEHFHVITNADELCSFVIQIEKAVARSLIQFVLPMVPCGKRLESLAMFEHGIEFEGIKDVKKTSLHSTINMTSSTDITVPSDISVTSCVSQIHNYSAAITSDSEIIDHSYYAVNLVESESVIIPKKGKKQHKCSKKSCKNKIQSLEKKVQLLEKQLLQTQQKLRHRTQQRNNLRQKLFQFPN